MTTFFTKTLCAALTAVAMLSACSRPVAYFQRGPIGSSAKASVQTIATAKPVQNFVEPVQLLTGANTAVSRPEAYVWQDSKLTTNKTLSRRMIRIRKILTSTTGTLSPEATQTPHKIKGIERLILRKINKQISKQLAPNHPEKALIKTGKLIGSVILLIAGLLMLILGTGTLAFIGLIVSLVGAVGTVVSLIGIDS